MAAVSSVLYGSNAVGSAARGGAGARGSPPKIPLSPLTKNYMSYVGGWEHVSGSSGTLLIGHAPPSTPCFLCLGVSHDHVSYWDVSCVVAEIELAVFLSLFVLFFVKT